ncbi:tape measure protein [Ochrobactrum daejeonense]|nr:tape measure protein [Brucella daejeonensis]
MRRAQKRMEEMLNSMGRSSDSAFNKIADRANADMRRIEEGAIKLRRQLDATFQQSFGSSLNKGLAAVGSVLGTNEVRKYADQWTTAENMLKAATAATGMQTRSLKELRFGADDARVSVEDYVDLYARMVRSASGVAKSENEIALATNLVSKAFKAGGASAQEQAAGILQLGQALGSGVLQGDELRSLRENAPIVAKAIADEFGVTVAKLKDLGAEGKLTSDRVFRAIINAQKTIEAQFAATNATIGDGMTAINNAMLQYIGTAGDMTGISATVSRALILISQNFDQVADAGMQLAAVLAGVLVGRSLGGMIRTLGTTTAALVKFHQAAKAAQGAMGLVQAMGGLGAAAGPLGAIIGGALVLAVGNYTVSAMAAQKTQTLALRWKSSGWLRPRPRMGSIRRLSRWIIWPIRRRRGSLRISPVSLSGCGMVADVGVAFLGRATNWMFCLRMLRLRSRMSCRILACQMQTNLRDVKLQTSSAISKTSQLPQIRRRSDFMRSITLTSVRGR